MRQKQLKVAFLSHRTPGHLHPMTTLARRLKARGHEVVFICVLDAEPFVRAAQLPFIAYGEEELPIGSSRKTIDQLSKLQGQMALDFVIRAIADTIEVAFKHLPRILREARADTLVLDQVQFGLGLVPMRLGMPYVTVSNALHIDFSGNTPLCTFDWPHEATIDGLARNREGVRKFDSSIEPVRRLERAYAEEYGLDVDWSDPFANISKLAWLTQTPKAFDFKSDDWPAYFHHTGPFHDGLGRIESAFPWERLTGEPLIYASMGTLQNGLEPVFSMIAEGVGDRAGMQLVVSIGPTVDAGQIKNLPSNTVVVKSAPQVELLKRSALCITHAGLNTTLESLTQGVPLVALPVTSDQPGVAARIAYTKTGAFTPLKEATAPRLRSLIDEVLSNPEYRQNAIGMKRAIGESGGLEKALDLLEEVFALTPR